MMGHHQQDFERIYGGLSELDLDLRFPLAEIGRFHWRRGEWNDAYYSYHYRRFTSHILSRLRLMKGQSILVVGCGFGFDEKNIRSLFSDVDLWSIDISREMLRLATASRSPSRFALAQAEALPFPDKTFHRILSREVIEHVMSPQVMLKEMGRVLQPGGIAVVTTENEDSLGPTNYYDERLRPQLARVLGFPLPSPEYRDQAPSLSEMKRMIHDAGLTLVEYFWDGALYKYLIELSPWVQKRMSKLAHSFSSLENNRFLARLFCDQIKYVLTKEGQPSSLVPCYSVTYACPLCKGTLLEENGRYACLGCKGQYPVQDSVPDFLPDRSAPAGPTLPYRREEKGVALRPTIGRRLFPRVNKILRASYGGVYLAMASLSTLLVRRNRRHLSRVLAPEDLYQGYLRVT
jgi:ubiquinone/menaquinone biosynthesis C-methylase UbiE